MKITNEFEVMKDVPYGDEFVTSTNETMILESFDGQQCLIKVSGVTYRVNIDDMEIALENARRVNE